jgi:hypothetical protein
MPGHRRLGRNDPCHCGSGKKYKVCHLRSDEEQDQVKRAEALRANREERTSDRLERGYPADYEHYHPLTRKIPAAERHDFQTLVARLSQTGGTPLLISTPQDLGRTQEAVDEALHYCAERGVPVEFYEDPPLGMVAGLQDLVDSMFGRGVYQLRQSGTRLHDYGHSRYVDEDGQDRFYLAHPDMEAMRLTLTESARSEALAQGITSSPLAWIMTEAQVLRHLTVHYLELPEWARKNIKPLLRVLIDEITDVASDMEGELRKAQGSAAIAASLPFALALPMAIDSPQATLQGMGLSDEDSAELVPHLERVRDGAPWILQAAAAAGAEGWDTFEGFTRWHDALEGMIPDFVVQSDLYTAIEDNRRPDDEEEGGAVEVEAPVAELAGSPTVVSSQEGGIEVGAAAAPPTPAPVDLPPVFSNPELFHPLGQVREIYAERRADTRSRRIEVESEQTKARQAKAEALAQVEAFDQNLIGLNSRLGELDTDLSRLGIEERAERVRMVATILNHGASQLETAAASWSSRREMAVDPTHILYEQTLAEHETMAHSGLLEKLPEGARMRLEAEAARARDVLRDLYGQPFGLALPVAVMGDPEVPTVTVALPLADDPLCLAPDSPGVTVATAVCAGLREALGSTSVTSIQAIGSGRCSLLRYALRDIGSQSMVDLLDLLGIGMEDATEHSVPLRRARIGVHCIALPDVDEGDLAKALTGIAAGTSQ